MSRITSKGQVTIPKDVRDAFGFEPGTDVEIVAEDGVVVLRKRPEDAALARWVGALRIEDGVDEFVDAARGDA